MKMRLQRRMIYIDINSKEVVSDEEAIEEEVTKEKEVDKEVG